MIENGNAKNSSEETETVISGQQSNATVIQLVAIEDSSRNFLRGPCKSHVNLRDFDKLIHPSPFQSSHSRNISSSSTPSTASKPESGLTNTQSETDIRKSSDDQNFSGILKDEKKSRFARSPKRNNTHLGTRKVTIRET